MLQTAEFLYETALLPELEYTFKHALTHEVAYGTLLQDRRRAVGGTESAGQLWWLGEHPRAMARAQQDLAIAANFRNFWAQIVARLRLGQVC